MQWNPNNLTEFTAAIGELFSSVTSQYVDRDRACVMILSGDLGAGKTTATQEMGRILGIKETIQSPTFVVRKSYETNHLLFKKMIHIDAYRLNEEENLSIFRFDEDFKSPETLVIIEWPEMIPNVIPKDAISVRIEHQKDGRIITLI